MKLDSVRELKASLLAAPEFTRHTPYRAGPTPLVYASFPAGGAAKTQPLPVALGVAASPLRGEFRLAVRVFAPFSGFSGWLERVQARARGEVDVRVVGPVRAQAAKRWTEKRTRPLVAGVSIGHRNVSAGTLGAFVLDTRPRGRGLFVLSNDHVLANEDRARRGDPVVQPGVADGGGVARDTVARYERAVRLKLRGNRVDAAIARLEPGVTFDVARLRGLGRLVGVRTTPLAPGDRVAKVGRTTGLTRGVVSAVEVDRVIVGYDRGELVFDGQVEFTGAAKRPFSRGGDSGSLIVDHARCASALLFAGNDAETTFGHPFDEVMRALAIRLASATEAREALVALGARERAAAKREAHERLSAHGRITGVGITTRRGKPALKVNFERAPRRRREIPKQIAGLPVIVGVTGGIEKQRA